MFALKTIMSTIDGIDQTVTMQNALHQHKPYIKSRKEVLNKLFRSSAFSAFRRWRDLHRGHQLPGSTHDLTELVLKEGDEVVLHGLPENLARYNGMSGAVCKGPGAEDEIVDGKVWIKLPPHVRELPILCDVRAVNRSKATADPLGGSAAGARHPTRPVKNFHDFRTGSPPPYSQSCYPQRRDVE